MDDENLESKDPDGTVRTKRSPRRILKGLLFIAIVGLLVAIAVYAPIFKVMDIRVSGNGYVPVADIERIAGVERGMPFFRLETDETSKRLLKDLRIESASVRRVFPGTIQIDVTVRHPVATVPTVYGYVDVDGNGVVLDAYRTLKHMPIPIITGFVLPDHYIGDNIADGSLLAALKYLQALEERPRSQISEVSLKDPSHIIAYTTRSVPIRLGNTERMDEKAALTDSFLNDSRTAQGDVEFVDFSYTSPVIKLKGEWKKQQQK